LLRLVQNRQIKLLVKAFFKCYICLLTSLYKSFPQYRISGLS